MQLINKKKIIKKKIVLFKLLIKKFIKKYQICNLLNGIHVITAYIIVVKIIFKFY